VTHSTDEPLTGGVASDVRIIRGPKGPVVVKRALGKLKVAADWRSDPARSAVEVEALRVAAELIQPLSVPRVLDVDARTNSFTMNLVEPRFRNWKTELLTGRLDEQTAKRAGAALAQWHAGSASRSDLALRFADLTYFEELRLEPFFRRVAQRTPDLTDSILDAAAAMTARRSALVHGDFSPKNLLVDGGEIVLLDFEVAHWGDPRFDIAFLLTHLLLKRMRRGADRAGFNALARAFLHSYGRNGLNVLDEEAARLIGCLLLARIDGASPVDYLSEIDIEAARSLARRLLMHPIAELILLFASEDIR
jgi:5-methylthioribose kinase